MDPHRSGDHCQVQAAAGQAVSGGPPSSATVSASAAASSLPPIAPSATHPAPAPDSAAVAPSSREQIAAASIENVHQGNDDNDGQTASAHGEMNAVIEELMNAPLRVNELPLPQPPALTAARYYQMDEDIKALRAIPPNVSEVPRPMAQIAEDLSNMDEAIKQNVKDASKSGSGMDPPLPQSQIAAFAEEMVEDDEGYGSKKKAAPTTEADNDALPASIVVGPPTAEEEEALQRAQDPPTPTVARAPSPPPTDQGRSPSNPGGQQQLPIRPPPPSMMPPPDDDADPPVPALPRNPSMHMVEATLVEEQPEIPVYDAIQVAQETQLEKYKKYIIVGLGLFFGGAAVVAGVSVSSNNGSSDRDTIEPEGVVLSTARPSESSPPSQSSSPSDVPSQRSTLRPSTAPSESSSPSRFPSVRPTLQPSQSANPSQSPSRSLRPSLYPSTSASPTPFCFGGEINILPDSFPDETSWTISRIDNVDGGANSKVVLEGSPKKEGYRTSDEACLEKGDYEFAIFDSGGDGIFSPGYYRVAFDGVVIVQGGDFESEDKVSFSLPLPSPPPSESSSPSEHPSASFHPTESTVPSQFPSFRPSVQPSNSFSPSTYWSTLNWSRQGLGFNGDASDDFFGYAVAFSADASTMAIGAPGLWGSDDSPGYVKVYRREGEASRWEQRGDTIRGEANGDKFGHSLALSEDGTTLSIGAPRHDSAGPDSGQVKVYEWNETAFDYVQMGDTLYGAASEDEFGYSLDISSGKILAVGAPYNNADVFNLGQVTIYAWDDASSNFQQRGEAIDGDAAGEPFGYSVSLAENGLKLAVGAPYNDSNGPYSGKVRVFEWDEATSNYEQLGDSLRGDAAGDWFGGSVSFSRDGTTLAIGAPGNDENGQSSGQVQVFVWDEAASNFEQIGQNLFGKAPRDEFGFSVSLSSEGKTLAIGAYQSITGMPGYLEVYGWDDAASEYKRHGQSLGGEASYDHFGNALALAGNGRDLVVGAPWNDRNGTRSGRVEVFHIEL